MQQVKEIFSAWKKMSNFQVGDKLKNSEKLDLKCYMLHVKSAATTLAVRKLVYTLRKGILTVIVQVQYI